MSVIRIAKRDRFVTIPNSTLRDARLSWSAKGLLGAMLSYPDDWEFNTTHLRSLATDGTRATRTAMHELIDTGYVNRRRIQGGWEYEVHESAGTEERDSSETVDDASQALIPQVPFRQVPEKHTTNTERPTKTEKKEELSSSSRGRSKTTSLDELQAGALIKVWNDHCGVLPSVRMVSAERQRKLAIFVSTVGDFEAAQDILRDATLAVASDDFWRKNKYGLDNLLAGGKVFQRAESYEAQHSEDPTIIPVNVGDAIRAWVPFGNKRTMIDGTVTEVTDTQVAFTNINGNEHRIPRRDVARVVS